MAVHWASSRKSKIAPNHNMQAGFRSTDLAIIAVATLTNSVMVVIFLLRTMRAGQTFA